MNFDQIYIDGQWIQPEGTEKIEVENPATEEIFATVPKGTKEDVDKAVQAAKHAHKEFKNTSIDYRKELMSNIKQGIIDRREELENAMRQELGSAFDFTCDVQSQMSINEIQASLDNTDKVKFEEDYGEFKVRREGVGVVAAITPWNYPLNQIQRKLTGAMLAGATMVLKPSSDTPITAFIFTEIIDKAGVPAGVFNLVPGSGSEVGDYLTGHEDVDMISFTGSTKVGKGLYEQAEKTVKELSLELGGKSPNVVLENGDLEAGVTASMDAVLNNTGQSCNALTRLIVPESRKEEAENLIKKYAENNVRIGDPNDKENTMGPVVSKAQYDRVNEYIEIGKKEATVLTGGNPIDGKGYFIDLTVFTDVKNDMTIAQEEIFGPVLVLITYEDEKEALEIANDTAYGLGSAVFGETEEKALDFARQIEAGTVVINGGGKAEAAPFGGYKQSGIGREVSWFGIEEYTEVKTLLTGK